MLHVGMETIRVLVVDDHDRLVLAFGQMWRAGSNVLVDGPFTVEEVCVGGPRGADAILVDLDREEGRGFATVVRVCGSIGSVPVIAFTADLDPELGAAVITAGANGLLHLADAETIERAFRRVIAGELVLPDDHLPSLVDRVRSVRADRSDAAHVGSLTDRELEVLRSLADGETTAEIAARLGISTMTVQSHVKNVLAKLGVHSKVEAVRMAWRVGAIAVPVGA